jgi:hypothetical protein
VGRISWGRSNLAVPDGCCCVPGHVSVLPRGATCVKFDAEFAGHHDALEFPNGEFVLLTRLCEGHFAMVLQIAPCVASCGRFRAEEDCWSGGSINYRCGKAIEKKLRQEMGGCS